MKHYYAFFLMKNFHTNLFISSHIYQRYFLHKNCLLVFAIVKLMIFIINRSQNHVSRGQNKLFKYYIKCIEFEVKRTFRRGSKGRANLPRKLFQHCSHRNFQHIFIIKNTQNYSVLFAIKIRCVWCKKDI